MNLCGRRSVLARLALFEKDLFLDQNIHKNTIFGAKVSPKVVENVTQKQHGFWVRFLWPFGSVLSPFWEPKVTGGRKKNRLNWALGVSGVPVWVVWV